MPAVQRASGPMLCVIAVVFLGGVAFGALAALNQPRLPQAAAPTTPEPTERSPAPAPPLPAKTPPKTEAKQADPPKQANPINPVASKPDPPKPPKADPKPEPPKVVAVSYEKQVFPVFKKHCLMCHGDPLRKADVDLRTLASAVMGGSSGDGAVPGKPEKSNLWLAINDGSMPPAGKERLTDAEKMLVKEWILSGAK